jgi:head-tail adaptor
MFFPGRLDRQVTIQQRTIAQNDRGTPVPTWATYKTTRAGRQYIRQADVPEDERPVYFESVRYWLRYDSGINRSMRLVDGSDTFTIEAIEEYNRKGHLVLTVRRSEAGRNG